jgi:hypothetical protein
LDFLGQLAESAAVETFDSMESFTPHDIGNFWKAFADAMNAATNTIELKAQVTIFAKIVEILRNIVRWKTRKILVEDQS